MAYDTGLKTPVSYGNIYTQWTNPDKALISDDDYAQGILGPSGGNIVYVALSYNNGSNWTAEKNTGIITASDQNYVLGGSTDTWGRSWTQAELGNSNFVIYISHYWNFDTYIYEDYSSFTFNLPENAVIEGIEIQLETHLHTEGGPPQSCPYVDLIQAKVYYSLLETSDRNSHISGIAGTNSDRNAIIKGQEIITADRYGRINGCSSIISDRNSIMKGGIIETSNRNAIIHGETTDNSDRNGIIRGSILINSDRNALMKGQSSILSDRNIRIRGGLEVNSDRNSKIHGIDTIYSNRTAVIHGENVEIATRLAKIKGQQSTNSNRNAVIHGKVNINSDRNAKIHGEAFEDSDRNVKIHGQLSDSSDRNAIIHGKAFGESDRNAKIHGKAFAQSDRNAYLRGGIVVESDRNAKIHGKAFGHSDRNGKTHGMAFADSDRKAIITGYIPPVVFPAKSVRKIFQFGDQLKDLFLFTPFEEEDDWDDSVEPALYTAPDLDGAYRGMGYDQSRKPIKVVTKRFSLYSKKLIREMGINSQGVCKSTAVCRNSKTAFMKELIDYMYRGLRGGRKRLYAIMEDGSIRYTFAEANTIPYTRVFAESNKWIPFSVDFIIQDPYWYEINDGQTFFFRDIPINDLICGCANMKEAQEIGHTATIGYDFKDCINSCDYEGVILRDETIELDAPTTLWAELGESYSTNGSTDIDVCINGSAGATCPKISFRENFTNPKVENLENGCTISYNGTIGVGEYIEINVGSVENGELEDMTIESNISGFDRNDITINNDGFFNLEKGTNTLQITGGTSVNSEFTIKFKNKYHN